MQKPMITKIDKHPPTSEFRLPLTTPMSTNRKANLKKSPQLPLCRTLEPSRTSYRVSDNTLWHIEGFPISLVSRDYFSYRHGSIPAKSELKSSAIQAAEDASEKEKVWKVSFRRNKSKEHFELYTAKKQRCSNLQPSQSSECAKGSRLDQKDKWKYAE